ncbi:MAG TPA: hypothetical protein VML55_02625 [Planctomycetaceae bacterium]|nr:hypothetical protein [Planctomycetaceae bacterium]
MATAKKTLSRSRTLAPGQSSPAAEWFARLTVSGQLLLFGGVAGVVVAFLPLVSLSGSVVEFPAGAMVIDDWRGLASVVGYLAAIVLAVALYPAQGASRRNHLWAAVGVGTVLVLLGVWLFIAAARTGGFAYAEAGTLRTGLGAMLNLAAAGCVVLGAVWKARQERLV